MLLLFIMYPANGHIDTFFKVIDCILRVAVSFLKLCRSAFPWTLNCHFRTSNHHKCRYINKITFSSSAIFIVIPEDLKPSMNLFEPVCKIKDHSENMRGKKEITCRQNNFKFSTAVTYSNNRFHSTRAYLLLSCHMI